MKLATLNPATLRIHTGILYRVNHKGWYSKDDKNTKIWRFQY